MRRYTTATEATSATEYLQCSSPPFVLHWVFCIADFHYGVPNYTVSKRQQYPPQSSDGMTIESQATTFFCDAVALFSRRWFVKLGSRPVAVALTPLKIMFSMVETGREREREKCNSRSIFQSCSEACLYFDYYNIRP